MSSRHCLDKLTILTYLLATGRIQGYGEAPRSTRYSNRRISIENNFRQTTISTMQLNNDHIDTDDDDAFWNNAIMSQADALDAQAAAAVLGDDGSSLLLPLPDAKKRRVSLLPDNKADLEQTLLQFFGYSNFRAGQREVIQAILDRRDVAVFWATGQGKSMNYQLPALHAHGMAVVVSPLISLMQDQCRKLNFLSQGTLGRSIATYLGSAQTDPAEQERAVRGEYALVYVTPEKLTNASSPFVERLAQLHQQQNSGGGSSSSSINGRRITLFAIDEAHCVSEWGHDFRPHYRQVGATLRQHPVLRDVPILALTATAVPRVQADIVTNLQLRDPLMAQQTFDRPNLHMAVHRKVGNFASNLQHLVRQLQNNNSRDGGGGGGGATNNNATIVYAPTRALVEDIARYLQTQLAPHQVRVAAYHAGLNGEDRTAAHHTFLTGQTDVVVATVAFGMGIDKPDLRRVIHYGPPKTVEEYYQQIGRAGRDGLPAECTMYANGEDVDKYDCDFYLGKLEGKALQAVRDSMKALRKYVVSQDSCRRRMLLEYFVETPSFGDSCGTCDLCKQRAVRGDDDPYRDFAAKGAQLVLVVIGALKRPSMTTILKVAGNNPVATFQYVDGAATQESVHSMLKVQLPQLESRYKSQAFLRELVPVLALHGYLKEERVSSVVNGRPTTWTTYALNAKGVSVLNSKGPIRLPVLEYIREAEQKDEEKRCQTLAMLEKNGIPTDRLPPNEIAKGEGEVISAYAKWYSYLESLREDSNRKTEMEELFSIVENWRAKVAAKYGMAPGAVLAEHLLTSVAYTAATMPPGVKLNEQTLQAAGLRARDLGELVDLIGQWVDRVQPGSKSATAEGKSYMHVMKLSGAINPQKWQYAVQKSSKRGPSAWERSCDRSEKGDTVATIALTPADGKIVQARTIAQHLLTGLAHGRAVNLADVATVLPPPSKLEWERLRSLEAETHMDVTGDPNRSGRDGSTFRMTDFLRPIMGEAFADKNFKDRSDEESAMFGQWCGHLQWYTALRRAGIAPTFE